MKDLSCFGVCWRFARAGMRGTGAQRPAQTRRLLSTWRSRSPRFWSAPSWPHIVTIVGSRPLAKVGSFAYCAGSRRGTTGEDSTAGMVSVMDTLPPSRTGRLRLFSSILMVTVRRKGLHVNQNSVSGPCSTRLALPSKGGRSTRHHSEVASPVCRYLMRPIRTCLPPAAFARSSNSLTGSTSATVAANMPHL